jgi:hypothetical protein
MLELAWHTLQHCIACHSTVCIFVHAVYKTGLSVPHITINDKHREQNSHVLYTNDASCNMENKIPFASIDTGSPIR